MTHLLFGLQVGITPATTVVAVPVARGLGLAVVSLELLAHALQVLDHQVLPGQLVVVREVVQPLAVVHLVVARKNAVGVSRSLEGIICWTKLLGRRLAQYEQWLTNSSIGRRSFFLFPQVEILFP